MTSKIPLIGATLAMQILLIAILAGIARILRRGSRRQDEESSDGRAGWALLALALLTVPPLLFSEDFAYQWGTM